MAQNVSHAVMSQRHEAHDSLDFFPTPPWATRALCEWLRDNGEPMDAQIAWEPACGAGDMARPLAEYFKTVHASDVNDYGFGEQSDFLFPYSTAHLADWIITNPPFRLGQQFAERALVDAMAGVALLVRTAFLESADRFEGLYRQSPPSNILQFVERVPMFKGRLDRHGSTATSYCWLVWRGVPTSTRFHWIAPCRKRLERDEDYR
jgi:hypothetical protein